MNLKSINPWWYAAGFGAILFLVWVFAFLLDSDPGCSVTGWDAIMQLSTGFWIFFFLGLAVGIGIIRWAIKKYNSDGGIDTGNIQTMLAIGALVIILVSLKGCDVKANCGTTGTKGNPENQAPKDDGRVPAEDLIKQK